MVMSSRHLLLDILIVSMISATSITFRNTFQQNKINLVVEDPCERNQHKPFPHLSKRQITSVDNNEPLSDRTHITSGWYGERWITLHHKSNNSFLNQCGTTYPIYITGTLNTSMKACELNKAGGCYKEYDIQVKNCGNNLVVYRLKKPAGYYSAYCAGPPAGVPMYSTDVTLIELEGDSTSKDMIFQFQCQFTTSTETLWYEVTWYVDDEVIYEPERVKDNISKATMLKDTHLTSANITLGIKLHCCFRAGFNKTSALGVGICSNKTFYGIEIVTPKLNVTPNEDATIRIKPSLPKEYWTKFGGNPLTIEVGSARDDSNCNSAEMFSDCSIKIDNSSNYYTNISTRPLVRNKFPMTKHLTLTTPLRHNPVLSNMIVGTVVIVIPPTTPTYQTCSATNDPHFSTFSGLKYDYHETGVYTLYKVESLNEEVQIKTVDCIGRNKVTCINSVVVQSGREVYRVQVPRAQNIYYEVQHVQCDDIKLLEVEFETQSLDRKILLPSGTSVTVKPSHEQGYVSVHIKSVEDIANKSSGLCRAKETSADDWKVQESSLFNEAYLRKLQPHKPVKVKCSNQIIKQILSRCSISSGKKKKKLCQLNSLEPYKSKDYKLRKKRSSPDWTNGWTEQKAKEFCLERMNMSLASVICLENKLVDIDGPLQNCIADIKILGNTTFVLDAVELLKVQCFETVETDSKYRLKSNNQPSIFDQLKVAVCLNECNDNGRCVEGLCVCSDDYGGADCAVNIKNPPVLQAAYKDGYCDVSVDECSAITVYGGEFVNDKHSLCRIRRPALMTENGTELSKEPLIEKSNIQSLFETICPLPVPVVRRRRSTSYIPTIEHGRLYRLALSNYGDIYSNELLIVVFNSKCQICQIKGLEADCAYKGNFCMSDGKCYGDGEHHLLNSSYICSVTGDSRTWTYIEVKPVAPSTPREDEKGGTSVWVWVVIGVVVMVCVMVCVAVMCFLDRTGRGIYKIHRGKQNQSSSSVK